MPSQSLGGRTVLLDCSSGTECSATTGGLLGRAVLDLGGSCVLAHRLDLLQAAAVGLVVLAGRDDLAVGGHEGEVLAIAGLMRDAVVRRHGARPSFPRSLVHGSERVGPMGWRRLSDHRLEERAFVVSCALSHTGRAGCAASVSADRGAAGDSGWS